MRNLAKLLLLLAVPVFASAHTVTLTWTASVTTDVDGYDIYRSTTTTGAVLIASIGNVTTYTDTNVVDGTKYYYVAKALSPEGQSGDSNQVMVTIPTDPPNPPTGLTDTLSHDSVALAWTAATVPAGSPPVTGYDIYRWAGTPTEVRIATLGNVLTYTDATVVAGKPYAYIITAINAKGPSHGSNKVSVLAQ